MSVPREIAVAVRDTATPALLGLMDALSPHKIRSVVGGACVRHVQDHLRGLGPNKQGFPTSNFYAGAARGTTWDSTPDGIVIQIDNAEKPGAMAQRYYGGQILAKDHLLSIPARGEFYNHSPTEFTNLKFVQFASGAKALVIGKGGVGRVNFETGREQNVRGAGVRSQAMVAYWLKDEVWQEPNHDVIPTEAALAQSALEAIAEVAAQKIRGNNG